MLVDVLKLLTVGLATEAPKLLKAVLELNLINIFATEILLIAVVF